MASTTTTSDGHRRHHHRGLDAIALPGDRDVARAVGDPDHAEGRQRDQRKEEKNADHRGPCIKALPSARRRRRRRAAGSRRWPCCAPRPWRSRPASGARALGRQLGELGQRAGDIALRRALLDARQDRGAVVAARLLVDRTDADQLLGVGLQASRKPPSRGASSAARSIGRTMAASSWPSAALPGTPDAANGSSSRDRAGIGRQRLDDRKLGGERIAALDRVAQRRRRDREPRRAVAAGGGCARGVCTLGQSPPINLSIWLLARRGAQRRRLSGAARQRGDIVGQRLSRRSRRR